MARIGRCRFLLPLAILAISPLAVLAQTASFNLPAAPLAESLKAIGAQANVNVLVTPALVDGKQAPALKAKLSLKDALGRLLEGSGLEYHFINDQTVVIREKSVAAANDPPAPKIKTADAEKETGKNSSQDFRVAQVDQGQTSVPSAVEKQDEQASKRKAAQLEEVVVTGSRIPLTAKDAAQQVKIYTRENIEQSGQTTVSDFLNTLPEVAVSINDNNRQTFLGSTTVQLHGLPVGTTLVLINGRRIETSGAQYQTAFFDLNTVPLAAVERIEVVSEGSSAIYGSDAIAGVVNIVLKKNFDGFDASVKYGGASGTNETDIGSAWGKQWSKGAVSIVASYQTRTELQGFERSITANNDYTRFGGPDNRLFDCNPGNVFTLNGSNLPGVGAPYAAVPAGFTGAPTSQEFARTAGTLNKCSVFSYQSYIPATDRAGVFASGSFDLTPSVEFFSELMFSHVKEYSESFPPLLDGYPSFLYSQFTVGASNPYNPFGEAVGVSGLLTSVGRFGQFLDTDFFRPLVGAKGNFPGTWKWELAGWMAQDKSTYTAPNTLNPSATQAALNSSDPATALNPFVAGAPGSPQLLQSLVFQQFQKFLGRTLAANGFARGEVLKLPSGPLELVVGGEYNRDKLYYDQVNNPFFPPNTQATFGRNSYAVFGEARIPILANHTNPQAGEILAVTVAERYDHYNDFGGKTTPQYGAEFRPFDGVLLRGTYGRAFKAPTLYDLYNPPTSAQTFVLDPRKNNQVEAVTAQFGGNPALRPETGESRTFGFVFSSKTIPDLRISATSWKVDESESIQFLGAQAIVNNESAFPGYVIRDSAGDITQVDAIAVNFGKIDVEGIDGQASYKVTTALGVFPVSLSVTETYRYSAAFQPGSPPTHRVSQASDDGNWAPRWKGTAALGWNRGPYRLTLDGRYVSRYQDYDSTREIGNFWLSDANFRYSVGQALTPDNQWLKGGYVELGGVNIFNKLPRFSNFQFGVVGYDPAESDIRGRFLYAQIGVKW